jgi:hypothetical protein
VGIDREAESSRPRCWHDIAEQRQRSSPSRFLGLVFTTHEAWRAPSGKAWNCDDPLTVHEVRSTFPAFEFQARPVVAVEDAVRVELDAIAWRDGLKGK